MAKVRHAVKKRQLMRRRRKKDVSEGQDGGEAQKTMQGKGG